MLVAALVTLAGRAPWTDAIALVLPLFAIYAFQCLPAWYLCRTFPLRSYGPLRVGAIMSAAAVVSSALWVIVGGGWSLLLARVPGRVGAADLFNRSYMILFVVGVLLFCLAVAVSYLAGAALQSREAEKQMLELEVLAREAELKALKAQIHPHFLFNSLNSLMALIGSNGAEARRVCLLLSDFLRQSLKSASIDSIPLSEELALIESYLAIEQVRFGSRLRVKLDVSMDCRDCRLPPLLCQPLIENAINHGIAHLVEGGEICVSAGQAGSMLLIRISNPCAADRPRTGSKGIGLANVRRRLAALYGNDGRIDVMERDGVFMAEIRLPGRACEPRGALATAKANDHGRG